MSQSNEHSESNQPGEIVPPAVVGRLSLYLRELHHLIRDGKETTSSTSLGGRLGFTDAQVRKDLAYFGQFGQPGVGYQCAELISQIKRILGTDRQWPVVLVGAGNLGRALLGYKGFGQQGFRIVAAVDLDDQKVGQKLEGITVQPTSLLSEIINQQKIKLAIIAVPSEAAQAVATKLVDIGVEGILNFAPVTLSLPEHVKLVEVDLAIELEQLSFAVVKSTEKP